MVAAAALHRQKKEEHPRGGMTLHEDQVSPTKQFLGQRRER